MVADFTTTRCLNFNRTVRARDEVVGLTVESVSALVRFSRPAAFLAAARLTNNEIFRQIDLLLFVIQSQNLSIVRLANRADAATA
jgi:hypothetical protein